MKTLEKPKRKLTKIQDYGKHYASVDWCGNCGQRNYCYIPKGILKKKCAPIICDNCGCEIKVR